MLIGNINRLAGNPARHMFGASALNDMLFPRGFRVNTEFAFDSYAAYPSGYYPPYCWVMARKAGALSSRYMTFIGITATGAIEVVPAVIAGTTTISVYPAGDILAYVAGEGSAYIGLSASLEKDAIAWLVGSTAFGITAEIEAYARGFMDGTTEDLSTLTPLNVGQFVWAALQSEINNPGSAGAALLAAGSAGDPWSTLMAPYTDDATFGAFVKKLLQTNEFFGLR